MTAQFPDHPAVDVSTSRRIRRPLDRVALFANDPANAPVWYANIDSVEWATHPPVQLGTQVRFVARFLGRTMRYTYEVVELTGSSLVMRTADGPFPMETSYLYRAVDDTTTEMTLRNRGNPSGFSRVTTPLMRPAMRRANRKDLAALAKALEGERPTTR